MFANAGIPMIVLQWPLMVAALIPVILIETVVVRRKLGMPFKPAFNGVAKANLFSTLLGVPLAWLTMFAFELVTLMPIAMISDHWHWHLAGPVIRLVGFLMMIAWLAPPSGDGTWMIPLASALLLIPSFFMSVWMERRTCLKAWPDTDPALVRAVVFRANLVSYAVLFLLACGWVGYALHFLKSVR